MVRLSVAASEGRVLTSGQATITDQKLTREKHPAGDTTSLSYRLRTVITIGAQCSSGVRALSRVIARESSVGVGRLGSVRISLLASSQERSYGVAAGARA